MSDSRSSNGPFAGWWAYYKGRIFKIAAHSPLEGLCILVGVSMLDGRDMSGGLLHTASLDPYKLYPPGDNGFAEMMKDDKRRAEEKKK
ncbi:MAG: hypothetical protein Q8S13_06635 [Dehalococcoidia bacterium]|nr:hypothetical protein [Dehalococcoidia bacterium]